MNEHSESRPDEPKATSSAPDTSADLQALQKERDHLEEQLRRTLADAQNMRRRAKQEADDARRRILEGFTQELLPVLDNFQFALQASDDPKTADPAALAQGVRMVLTLLRSALERHGLQEIAAEGQTFDPARHEAVAVEPKEGVEKGRVLRVLMPGYLMSDRVLRHAKVVVSGDAKSST